MGPVALSARFYDLINAVQANSLTTEQQTYLTALLEDTLEKELHARMALSALED